MGVSVTTLDSLSEKEYKRRVWAWTMYDWANSAFATTILAAVLPVYFSQVAGATLPSASVATAYWSLGLSISLFIIAILSPILGTISDIMRGKKRFLAIFAGIGIAGTALLVLVGTGDWILASILGIIGRIGFNGSISFYDSLLAHVAKPDDQDRVSARGYAMGYLGGGLLLAVNVVMLQVLPGTWGARLSFLSVAIWWGVFSIPLFRNIPEPVAASGELKAGENIVSLSFKRLGETIKDIRRYAELFKFLIAFLIYNDGIGTIIGVAAIYGAELGFGSVELILALLLVQFVGIPYSLIFGRLPTDSDKRRPIYLAFILFNLIALPLAGIFGSRILPVDISGAPAEPFASTPGHAGEGSYFADSQNIQFNGQWQQNLISADQLGIEQDKLYLSSSSSDARYDFPYNGQKIKITYNQAPDQGIWAVYIDGQPYIDEDTSNPLEIDAYNPTIRYEVEATFIADSPGEHTFSLVNTGKKNTQSDGTGISLAGIEVMAGIRQSNLGLILGLIIALEIVGFLLALAFGKMFFSGWVKNFDTKRSITLALVMYSVIATWGFFLNSVVEYWMLAWMVSIVQGGSQALSRSIYARMSPASKSGEFFGLFGVMEKFSAILGPLAFAAAGTLLGSSRPAILSLILFFFLGGYLLTRVNVDEGKRIAREEDAAFLRGETQA
ncbi:MAG: MFS transporter [Anaerolineales bacterium]|nr:MFS transporter [Anaerolineales bacterium]